MRFNVRLDRLEKTASEGFPEALRGIVGVKYYDELTDDERALWVQYRWGSDVDTFESVESLCAPDSDSPNWHFICDRKPKPPTDEELKRARVEIEQLVLNHYERNN